MFRKVIVLLTAFLCLTHASAVGGDRVKFDCPNLEKALCEIAGKQNLSAADMRGITGHVDLSNRDITSVAGLEHLAGAESLDLSCNRIKDITPLTRLKGLRSLDMCTNRLKTLPVDIDLMESLQALDLSGNRLDELPRQIADIPQLTKLVMADCGLRSIPELQPLADTLKWLSLSGNDLLDYSTLLNLENLELLQLERCNLSVLPDLSLLSNLHYLYLNHNNLKKLPAYLADLPLWRFEAKYNHLSVLPDSFAGLSELEQLVLTGNAFTELPGVVLAMQELEVLMLEANMITSLPNELMRLSQLRRISFAANDIGSLDSLSNFIPAFPAQISFSMNRLDYFGMSTTSVFVLAGLGTGTQPQKEGGVRLEIIKADAESMDFRLNIEALPDWEEKTGGFVPAQIRLYDMSPGHPVFLQGYDAADGLAFSYSGALEAGKNYKLRVVLVMQCDGDPKKQLYYYDDLVVFELAPAPTPFSYPDWLPPH